MESSLDPHEMGVRCNKVYRQRERWWRIYIRTLRLRKRKVRIWPLFASADVPESRGNIDILLHT